MVQRVRRLGTVSAQAALDGEAGDCADFGVAVIDTCGGEARAAGLMVEDRLGVNGPPSRRLGLRLKQSRGPLVTAMP